MCEKINLRVSLLEGYLAAISDIDGHIREFHASAFLIDKVRGEISIDLVQFFKAEINIYCQKIERIEKWQRYLEQAIRQLILNEPLRSSHFEEQVLEDRKSYISFRIMDMIDLITEDESNIEMYEILAKFEHDSQVSRFFALDLKSKNKYLILRFLRE